MLKVEGLHVYYGAIHALKDISFEVREKEIVTLIGANGAGKTTTLHAVSGLLSPKAGSIRLDGHDLMKTPAEKIVGLGLAQVPEGRRVFARMSVHENLMMGAYLRKDKAAVEADLERMYGKFPRLRERSKQLAGTMSGGEQQMLAIARALMSKPKLLLMDEPSMGLAPILVDEIFKIIQEINEMGTTVLLVEQNAHKALAIAHRAYVLETGKVLMEGDAKTLLDDERVKHAYLG
ncbi:ABC transporter ATP-binding protein [Anaerotalea alkaliphila]|uniref:ABC transporter ATP-binding protein n=1 Tax=Anaerotalea alkaliphila TaxID=2662126 RepID=A0A7X5KKY7_9FIRM|nr:ABC transporter ATP-binding protein [Anaerotalea alkaliphila]NDL66271.1 ABC transporter ATP-binding protein [Anaerotalea alkaliphila]